MLLISAACTNTRWVVEDPMAIDYEDYKVVQSKEFLQKMEKVSPEDPTLKLHLFSHNTYEYAKKVLMRRTIQDYRPRPGFVALGLAGAALSVYAANNISPNGDINTAKGITLNAVGGLMALSGFLSMKPVGEPRDTGEERMLRRTGAVTDQDTLEILAAEEKQADFSIMYGNKIIRQTQDHTFQNGKLEINLATALSELDIKDKITENVSVYVEFQDSTYQYVYSLDNILQPFARISSPITQLRNTPVETPNNILAELMEGGELQIVDDSNSGWYKVLYGISENYIPKSDAELIWRSSEMAQNNPVVAVPRIPFGNIDVETNIPILRGIRQNAAALILTNESYQGELSKRRYAHRDGQLMKTYLKNALGFPEKNIFEIQDMQNVQALSAPFSAIDSLATDSTELFVFISGYGSIHMQNGSPVLGFIPSGKGSGETINLSDFFRRIASIPSGRTVVVADVDFSQSPVKLLEDRNVLLQQPLRRLADIITPYTADAAVFFGSELGQKSAVYLNRKGEDKKHRIFAYFFARALQQRRTTTSKIYQFLERNVTYHTRRLHDYSQDPLLFGKRSVDLASD